jgi:hypothetical protein
VGSFAATDAEGDTVAYALGGTDAGSFAVDASGGLRVGAAVFDHETASSYVVSVTASDSFGGSASAAVTVRVTDVDEPPGRVAGVRFTAQGRDTFTAEWDEPLNTGPGISNYVLQYRQVDTPPPPWEEMDASAESRSATVPGLDGDESYEVEVRAVNDEGDGAWSPTATVATRANSAPVFDSGDTTLEIAENTPPADLGDLSVYAASDVDSGDTVTYSLADGAAGSGDAGSFVIDASSGQLSAALAAVFDHETESSYLLSVEARDSGSGLGL